MRKNRQILLFFFYFISFFSVFFLLKKAGFCFEMESSNYRIQDSSINIGGAFQTSTNNYRLIETLGEIAGGISTTSAYKIFAGYQQMQESFISLSIYPSSVFLPSIGGVSGGQTNGSTTITVITDNPAGYSLEIKASNSPALVCSAGGCAVGEDKFNDYTPNSFSVPDFNWFVPSNTSEFGFTPEGSDIVQKFRDNAVDSCNTANNDTPEKCWYNFSTSSELISFSYSSNHPNGVSTVLKFRAESGSQNIQVAGDYSASFVVTAISN